MNASWQNCCNTIIVDDETWIWYKMYCLIWIKKSDEYFYKMFQILLPAIFGTFCRNIPLIFFMTCGWFLFVLTFPDSMTCGVSMIWASTPSWVTANPHKKRHENINVARINLIGSRWASSNVVRDLCPISYLIALWMSGSVFLKIDVCLLKKRIRC